MKKAEILKRYKIEKLDDITVFISNRYFDFSYTKVNDVLKPEYRDKYRYFGGLQCPYHEGSPEYRDLEKWLC